MAKTLNSAFKELTKQTCGQVVAKSGFEIGERVIAYVCSISEYNGVWNAMVMRHDNYRRDLKDYKYCEVVHEFGNFQGCPNDLQDLAMKEMQYDWRLMTK